MARKRGQKSQKRRNLGKKALGKETLVDLKQRKYEADLCR